MSEKHHQEGHAGSHKKFNPLLVTLVFALVLCVGLVSLLKSSHEPVSHSAAAELAQAKRLQKVGSVEIRSNVDRPLVNGEEVYKGQCAACHATGVSGAPKFGDAAEWGPRLGQGFDALVQAALKGKGAMAPQGGGNFNDLEIARAVAYMANAAGANFPEPQPEAKEGESAQ